MCCRSWYQPTVKLSMLGIFFLWNYCKWDYGGFSSMLFWKFVSSMFISFLFFIYNLHTHTHTHTHTLFYAWFYVTANRPKKVFSTIWKFTFRFSLHCCLSWLIAWKGNLLGISNHMFLFMSFYLILMYVHVIDFWY